MTARNERNTYFARAQADADLVAGGRFTKLEANRVTGVPVYPALPLNSPWHHDPVPREEPLGQNVDATMIPVGTEAEIAKSLATRPTPTMRAPTPAPDSEHPLSVETTDVGARSIRRRRAP